VKITKLRGIRVDNFRTIKLQVSKWFPALVLLTIVLAAFGSFFYGDIIRTTSSSTAGLSDSDRKAKSQNQVRRGSKKLKNAASIYVSPKIIGAETKQPHIKVELESTSIVGDYARVTYRIYNTGNKTISGSTWAIGENPNQPLNKQILPWKARTFTRKTASFPISNSGPGEFKIYVSDDLAKTANSYTVRF